MQCGARRDRQRLQCVRQHFGRHGAHAFALECEVHARRRAPGEVDHGARECLQAEERRKEREGGKEGRAERAERAERKEEKKGRREGGKEGERERVSERERAEADAETVTLLGGNDCNSHGEYSFNFASDSAL